jgi:hypothetical protein
VLPSPFLTKIPGCQDCKCSELRSKPHYVQAAKAEKENYSSDLGIAVAVVEGDGA